MELVTIGITSFNAESTIIRAIECAINQDYQNYEIIVVDDCSTDNSKNLLNENRDLFSKLVELDKNLGKGGAVKEGLKNATGDYVLFQDGDLEYSPKDYGKIFRMLHQFKADIVIGSRFL